MMQVLLSVDINVIMSACIGLCLHRWG